MAGILFAGLVAVTLALCAPLLTVQEEESRESLSVLEDTRPSVQEETGGSLAPATSLPLPLSSEWQVVSVAYTSAETLESWRVVSDESCRAAALTVLESVRAAGYELVQAGYLDVSGESWGCVFVDDTGGSVTVTLLPERPFNVRSDENGLVLTIIRYLSPEEVL